MADHDAQFRALTPELSTVQGNAFFQRIEQPQRKRFRRRRETQTVETIPTYLFEALVVGQRVGEPSPEIMTAYQPLPQLSFWERRRMNRYNFAIDSAYVHNMFDRPDEEKKCLLSAIAIRRDKTIAQMLDQALCGDIDTEFAQHFTDALRDHGVQLQVSEKRVITESQLFAKLFASTEPGPIHDVVTHYLFDNMRELYFPYFGNSEPQHVTFSDPRRTVLLDVPMTIFEYHVREAGLYDVLEPLLKKEAQERRREYIKWLRKARTYKDHDDTHPGLADESIQERAGGTPSESEPVQSQHHGLNTPFSRERNVGEPNRPLDIRAVPAWTTLRPR